MPFRRGTTRILPACLAATFLVQGCTRQQTTREEPYTAEVLATESPAMPGERDTSQGVTSTSWVGYTPNVPEEMLVTELAFPTGEKASSAILLHEIMPKEVLRGAEYFYEYHVTNLTSGPLQEVVLTRNAENMEVTRSTPTAVRSAAGTSWSIDNLSPHETRIVKVTAMSETIGPASDCVSVAYSDVLCVQTTVVEPGLLVVKTATSEGILCDQFILEYAVTNPGTGSARNIRIKDTLASGLRTEDGRAVVEFDAGDLAPGESRIFTATAKGVETGTHGSIAIATADGGLISRSQNIQTVIHQPLLRITSESRDEQFIGRDVEFRFQVTNTGDAVAEKAVVTAEIPAGAELVRASREGFVRGNQVMWQIGSLAPRQSIGVDMRVKPAAVGTVGSTATVSAVCAETATDASFTSVVGIPAMMMELVDSGDPAAIADEVTYVIRATNQGSAPDTNIRIVCRIPEEQEYLSSDGPTLGTLRGQTLTFAPLGNLAPGANAEWRVRVWARKAGDVRFNVSMVTDRLTVPVEKTEATYLYE